LRRELALDPDDARYYDVRGWYLLSIYKYDAALADFDQAIELEPLDPSYYSRRAHVFLRKEELQRALGDIDEAIRLNPEEAYFYHQRAQALLYHNPDVQPLSALPDLEEAIRLDPSSVGYRMDRGFIRFYLEQWADAGEDFACQEIGGANRFILQGHAVTLIWLYLARLFQGDEEAGRNAVTEYLNWYAVESAAEPNAKPLAERLQYWPILLARLLAGEINARQLRELPSLDLTRPGLVPLEVIYIEENLREYHFVVGELLLSTGNLSEALPHLKEACKLRMWTPMRWVASRQIASRERATDNQ
jgi:tetratricopeptide (TPR) repeat protein